MKLKKIFLFIFLFIFTFTTTVIADNESDESINLNEIKKEILETSSDINNEPDINSRAAIVIDRNSKAILYGKCETEQRKMASTTKIMTAIIVLENANLYDIVTISQKAAGTGGSRLGLKTGDTISVCDLLYGLMLKSGNDTAVALAEYVGGSLEGFADLMNKKASELGLHNTHFVTPHGLDNDNHYTTAYELALLTDYALKNETFCNYVGTQTYTVTISGYTKSLNNTNELLGHFNGVYGVKTGFTNGANRCLVTACKRDNLDIICIVLGADSKKFRTQDSIKLIDYCFNNYEVVNLEKIVNDNFNNWKENNSSKFQIIKGECNNLELELSDFSYKLYPIKKKNSNNIHINIDCNYTFNAPLASNTSIGTLTAEIDDNKTLEFNIINTNSINKKDTLYYFKEMISNFSEYLVL